MQKHDEHLFGHITDTIKSKKQTKEIFIEHKKTFHLALHTIEKTWGPKCFLTTTGSKKFHSGNQQQQHNVIPFPGNQQKFIYFDKKIILSKSIQDVPLAGRLKLPWLIGTAWVVL